MTLVNFLIIAASAYLLGSLSFAIIVCRVTLHKDIRAYGSGNAGLTNAYRTMGAGKTAFVLLGDILKGVAAISIGGMLDGQLGKLIAGVFVIVGHVFPVYFGFRGGKGVLVGAVLLALFDWRIFAIAFALFVIIVVLTKWISLGSICATLTFPFTTYLFYRDWPMTAIAAGLAAAVVFLHRSNIKRILSGTENKFSFHGKPQIEKGKPKIKK
ncbi:MAG: glycerol-3-phosphate 1-O-acyltransferase PlsY [Intestinibacillus sp.]